MSTAQPYHSGYLGFNFVAYGNRDSTGYRERYRIPDAETVVRGTMRYNGFPQFVKALVDIGFLSTDDQDFFKQSIPWKDALQKFIGANSSSEEDLTKAVLSKTSFKDESVKNQVLAGLKWIGVFSDVKTTPAEPLSTPFALLLSRRWLTRRASVTLSSSNTLSRSSTRTAARTPGHPLSLSTVLLRAPVVSPPCPDWSEFLAVLPPRWSSTAPSLTRVLSPLCTPALPEH
ncbi:hypothetical protein NXS19_000424 [Fusarium pseudograminearum]|nr:hypothetical protein NXS19_000424 [Fusarium pseudograminearum]